MKELPIKLELPEGFLEEEVRCGYTVTEKIKAVWAIEMDLYKELERVCAKHNLILYADGGTVIGAVRHQGFIPWDDDMDFCLSRVDYEKLCRVAEDEFTYPYFWQTEATDPGTARGHGQLRNLATTAINDYSRHFGKVHGIFIDIFPYDNVPEDTKERHDYLRVIDCLEIKRSKYRELQYGINYSKGLKKLIKKLGILYVKTFHPPGDNPYYKELEHFKLKYKDANTLLWSNLYAVFLDNIDRCVLKKEYYRRTIDMPFEMITVKVPALYDEYLTHVYGNWREFVIGANVHGEIIFDPYTPYGQYLEEDKRKT